MAFKPIVMCSVSIFSLMAGTAAYAQVDAAPAAQQGDAASNEDIVVTGVRASIVGALNVRKESIQIVDSIVAEDVGKLPDNNVVEALQRVTGVQVTDRGGGEAATVTIRGLADPLTTLNGRNVFTAAGQSFALQDVSANLVRQVDVYKTRSADQIETGLAGQIDVKTRRPFDFDGFAISGLARGIYNEQADTYNPNVALLVSDRWETGIGDIGVLVNGSWSRTKYRNMSTTAGAMVPFLTDGNLPGVTTSNMPGACPQGAPWVPYERLQPTDCRVVSPTNPNGNIWTPGTNSGLPTGAGSTLDINGQETPYVLSRDAVFSSDLYGKRERPSVNAAVQWAPNSSSVYTAEVFYSGFRGNTFNSLQFSFVDWWGNPGAVELYDGTNIVKARTVDDVYGFNSGDYATNKTDSFVYALNGQWDLGDRGKIIGDVAYQTSTNKTSFIAMRTDRVAQQITADFNAGGGVPSYHFDDDSLLTDPSVWNVAQLYDNADKNKGSAVTLTLDGYYTWDEGFLRRVKAGVRYDDRKASSFTRTQDANNLGAPLSSLGEDAQFTNSGFFDGRADVPTSWTLANGYWLHSNADYVRGLYGLPTSGQLSLDRVFDIDETTMSAYVMADGEVSILGRPLQLEGGVRFVAVSTKSNFFNRLADGELTRAGNSAEKFLPSFTARYEITPRLRLRFNYGETLRRPNFTDINPNYSLTGDLTNVGYGSGTAGTANLKPTHSKNYDLALEWYFERNSAIYVTGFRREINGLVVPLTVMEHIPDNDIVAGATDNFAITRPVNASDGVLKGVEVGLTYYPNYLPGILDGLGFQGSLTVLDSNQTIPETDSAGNITGETQSQFFNVSKLSYNTTLAYDKGPFNARLSYIWRKGFLHNNEARLFANPIGIWYKPESSLDLQLTWNVTDNIGVTFDAVNLLKSKQQSYYKYGNAGDSEKYNLGTLLLARTFALGARFSF
ncbi:MULTISPECIES: TonB-dependent receptor [Edaphosphingomonas]|uniref:TonB-dependent receptor n=2 Tax=Edaphosphingomonas TaxID=3423724 RepID=A0A2T4HLM8_9SPHN|nr:MULTISPECIES: TonB-dependent receptor [Sphingomonas]MDX3885319.1 TonB-dependent receptor [Sphingomonas sp.]OHT21433.1 Vitamin B12 transporter BtuB [Sphingomonas haloaromaticamans]PTD16689.1 TonB-dependent receptor [Sphingomonas fennica]